MSSHKRMVLIDAHSLIFQVFHAIPEMSSPTGLPTNALFGFTRDMIFLRTDIKPDYWVCAFDLPGKTFRDKLFPEYKAQRPPIPADLEIQIPLIRQLLDAMHIPVVAIEGYEADDVIATIARLAEEHGLEVLICTGDKDCRQLITDRVRLYNLRKKQEFGRRELLADWGITPEQVVDLQTLVGDTVDNVPGVPGVGVKTAAKLLQEFGSLDNLIAEVQKPDIPGQKAVRKPLGPKTWENLKQALPKLEISRQLVRLDSHVPLTPDWEGWKLQEWDTARLLELFREWGFRGLADQVRRERQGIRGEQFEGRETRSRHDESEPSPNVVTQQELFSFGANSFPAGLVQGEQVHDLLIEKRKAKTEDFRTTHLVNTPRRFQDFYERLRRQKRFAIDLETTGLDALRCELVGYAFCWQPGEAWYLPVRGPAGQAVLDPEQTLDALRPILENPYVAKVNQNIKFDLLVLRANSVEMAGVAGDPMVADYLLHAGERGHGMNEMARRYLNYNPISITELLGKNGKNQLRMDQVPTERVAEYAGEDAEVAWRLCEYLEPELAQTAAVGKPSLRKLYDDLEIPLIEVLAELEFNGIRLDVPRLRRLSAEMDQQLAGIERDIHAFAGYPFNIASPQQLRQVLFEELKLPVFRKTGIKGEPSTDQETLEKLAQLEESKAALPRKIIEYREIAKLKGTYVDALPELVNPHTGRVHASFNQTVAATGRLSSSDPNLQNIPIRTEQGRQIRQAFLPAEGWQLLKADYSQIELRLLAEFSRDEALRQAFVEDRDIHAAVAAQIFGVAESDVLPEMRRMAKTVNFGVIYGMSAVGLAQRLSIDRLEAARFIAAYFARYPQVLEYQTRLLEGCRQRGYVSTILGRRRAITGIRGDSTYQQRNQPEREAINMEIQGSAADLLKLAMLNVYRRMGHEGLCSRMLLTVHDELVFEVPPDELDDMAALVHEEMTSAIERALHLEVPLKVDIAAGPNWLDVETVRLELHS